MVRMVAKMNAAIVAFLLMVGVAGAFDVPLEWENNLPEGLEGTTFIERSNLVPDTCFTDWSFRVDVPIYDTTRTMAATPDDGIYCFRVGHDTTSHDAVTNRWAFVCWDTRARPLVPPAAMRTNE